jgi:hypothetical protein
MNEDHAFTAACSAGTGSTLPGVRLKSQPNRTDEAMALSACSPIGRWLTAVQVRSMAPALAL